MRRELKPYDTCYQKKSGQQSEGMCRVTKKEDSDGECPHGANPRPHGIRGAYGNRSLSQPQEKATGCHKHHRQKDSSSDSRHRHAIHASRSRLTQLQPDRPSHFQHPRNDKINPAHKRASHSKNKYLYNQLKGKHALFFVIAYMQKIFSIKKESVKVSSREAQFSLPRATNIFMMQNNERLS